ncbi:MAG: sigma-54 dependent transcriptional regulator [Desulfohalobiaceae bacterium]|nr:sigma-54 dependent transcriptional regulator [Desulfohalobiaceae bacterium]
MDSKILIVDDDQGMGYMLSRICQKNGYPADQAFSLDQGLKQVRSRDYDLVLLDIYLPDGNGLQALEQFVALANQPEVIIITGLGDPDGAELAIKTGAWDYIQKTQSVKQMQLVIDRALRSRRRAAGTRPVPLKRRDFVGKGQAMLQVLQTMTQAAANRANVLITGETGTGKERAARTIHENSPWSGGGFVVVDCASLTENLAESTLFGHLKGAYTGAHESRQGLVSLAHDGVLFLDEVGELSPHLQKVLLRVLQEKAFRPVGSNGEQSSRFKLLAATHRNLQEMVSRGHFREDLYYRLKSIVVEIPPLREHLEDLKGLVQYHVTRVCEMERQSVKGISDEILEVLAQYPWPGNVRELFQVLESSLAAAGRDPMLYPEHLPLEIRALVTRKSVEKNIPSTAAGSKTIPGAGQLPDWKTYRGQMLARAEETYLKALMARANGQNKIACQLSGLSRTRLYTLLKAHGLK